MLQCWTWVWPVYPRGCRRRRLRLPRPFELDRRGRWLVWILRPIELGRHRRWLVWILRKRPPLRIRPPWIGLRLRRFLLSLSRFDRFAIFLERTATVVNCIAEPIGSGCFAIFLECVFK